MPRGGSRPGAGRPRKGKEAQTKAAVKAEVTAAAKEAERLNMTPLDYLLSVINDPAADKERRDRLAIAAAPYVHPRADLPPAPGKKQQRQAAAGRAAQGKFAPAAPPKHVN